MVHYCIVRRDLPLGILSAMLVHAAGESSAVYVEDTGRTFYGATAVVLEVKNQAELVKTAELLKENGIEYVPIYESDPPYSGEFMAIGVVPQDRAKVGEVLKDYQTLKQVYLSPPETEPQPPQNQPLGDDTCSCSNCRIHYAPMSMCEHDNEAPRGACPSDCGCREFMCKTGHYRFKI